MTLDIEKIKAAAMAATQGEWKCHWKLQWSIRITDVPGMHYILGGRENKQLTEQDAEFIALANPQAVLELITRLEAAEKDAAKYQELIYAVGRKFHDETRHETAMKYIRQMEEPSKNAAMKGAA